MLNLTKEQVDKLINTKPSTNVTVHLTSTDIENIAMNLSTQLSNVAGNKYRILRIANVDFFITEEQAEKIFEVQEKALYEETFAEIEDKYLTEKVRADRLEEELELLKERLREVV